MLSRPPARGSSEKKRLAPALARVRGHYACTGRRCPRTPELVYFVVVFQSSTHQEQKLQGFAFFVPVFMTLIMMLPL